MVGMTCLCKICLYYRQVAFVRNYGSMREKQALIDELYDRMCHAEFDNDYWDSIRSGEWPQARQIAEDIIKRVERFEAARATRT
jgi:hypothetical protein